MDPLYYIFRKKLREYGVVDLIQNAWFYNHWSTTEWPNTSQWSLTSNQRPVRVAHYGAYSGSTNNKGITAPLVYCSSTVQPSIDVSNKIVVLHLRPSPYPMSDYEYQTDQDTFPPAFEDCSLTQTITQDMAAHFTHLWANNGHLYQWLSQQRPKGCVMVFPMSYDHLAGFYTFPVPVMYHVPTLYVDADAGKQVIQDAHQGKTATLRLIANVQPVKTWQLIGYLPGKHYGFSDDEQILLTTHTDGPSISQDNGALGILSLIAYFATVSQVEREKTLLLYLDNRHYMPGREEAYCNHDWLSQSPLHRKSLVAKVAIEHLGQREYCEIHNKMHPTGLVEPTLVLVTPHQPLIDSTIHAVQDNKLSRAIVRCPSRLGVHNKSQGRWAGLGRFYPDLPGYGILGTLGAYWTTRAHIDRFDKHLFVLQVRTMVQLITELMTSDTTHITL